MRLKGKMLKAQLDNKSKTTKTHPYAGKPDSRDSGSFWNSAPPVTMLSRFTLTSEFASVCTELLIWFGFGVTEELPTQDASPRAVWHVCCATLVSDSGRVLSAPQPRGHRRIPC